MISQLFNTITNKDKSGAVERLITLSSPNRDFFLMMILSVLMASLGLLINNAPVVVGSMLIAPVLYPVLSLALGIIISDYKLVYRSLITLSKSFVFGAIIAAIAAIFFQQAYNTEGLISFIQPSLIHVVIAAVAGLAASFALVKPQLNETLPGVAIAVTLVPPIATFGIGIAHIDAAVALNALLMFFVNVFGIVFTSMIVFSLMNFYVKKEEVVRAIKEEEKELKEEKQQTINKNTLP